MLLLLSFLPHSLQCLFWFSGYCSFWPFLRFWVLLAHRDHQARHEMITESLSSSLPFRPYSPIFFLHFPHSLFTCVRNCISFSSSFVSWNLVSGLEACARWRRQLYSSYKRNERWYCSEGGRREMIQTGGMKGMEQEEKWMSKIWYFLLLPSFLSLPRSYSFFPFFPLFTLLISSFR